MKYLSRFSRSFKPKIFHEFNCFFMLIKFNLITFKKNLVALKNAFKFTITLIFVNFFICKFFLN